MAPVELACFSYLSGVQTLHVTRYPAADYGAEVHRVERFLAADGPIVAGAAAMLGRRAALVTNGVADDELGQYVLGQLQEWGVHPAQTSAGRRTITPFSTVVVTSDGTRTWFPYLPDVAAELAAADLDVLGSAQFAYIDCYEILGDAPIRAISAALGGGVRVLANLGGSPPPDWLTRRQIGSRLHILQTNVADDVAGTAEGVADELVALGVAEIVIVTKGCHGATVRFGGSAFDVPAIPVPVNRVQGAGSVFSAALIDGLLSGAGVVRAVAHACVAGSAWCCGDGEPPTIDRIRALAESYGNAGME